MRSAAAALSSRGRYFWTANSLVATEVNDNWSHEDPGRGRRCGLVPPPGDPSPGLGPRGRHHDGWRRRLGRAATGGRPEPGHPGLDDARTGRPGDLPPGPRAD